MADYNHIQEAAPVLTKMTYTFSGSSVIFGWLDVNLLLTLLSTLAAILAAGATIYFKWKENKRQQQIHERRLKELDNTDDHCKR